MKKWTMFAMLSIFACAGISRASADDVLSGPWHGVVRKGMLENVVYFDFSRTDTGYRGTYWGMAPTGAPVSLSVTWLIFGLCVLLPWALVGYGGYRLVRRLFRAPPAPVVPPTPAAVRTAAHRDPRRR